MKSIFYSLSAAVLLFASFSANAQETEKTEIKKSEYIPRNIIKTNLTGILFRNYSLQYERVITRRFSASLEYRLMPEGPIPAAGTISDLLFKDNLDVANSIDGFRMKGSAITPSVRFYPTRKGYGRGFYVSAFYRNVSYDMTIPDYTYDDGKEKISLKGDLKTNTFGFTIGKQWTIGRFFVIDYTIFGLQYGSASGNLTATNSQPLTADQQNTLRSSLESLDIPFVEKQVEVGATRSNLAISGPWAGFRTGVSIGIRF
ncbi:MAG: hypothetical protein V4616_05460 [Bacteroidota bacterium]